MNMKNELSPLTSWVKLLDQAISLLPRKSRNITLKPITDIVILNITARSYLAKETPPLFKVELDFKGRNYGWFYLEFFLIRHTGDKVAKIFFDRGNGISDADSIFIPVNLRGTVREVIYVPKDTIAIYWQPSTSAGWFTQSMVQLHQISALESFDRRLWRALNDYSQQKEIAPAELKKEKINVLNIYLGLNRAYAWSTNLRLNKSTGLSYDSFIKKNDVLTNKDILKIQHNITALIHKPLLSIIMPVYNPPLQFFREAIDSILAQLYPNWELCITDDASTNPEVISIINQYKNKDSRIKATFHSTNQHISAASNSALQLATGEYLVLMDHDDIMPPHALYHVATEINQHPDSCIIYSDEDKINEYGIRFDPYFKPHWNEDLFYSQNIISHLGVYKTSLIKEISGFRIGYEGSQDYDLALRCLKKINKNQIRHIPKVLYHWRAHAESTAFQADVKEYANTTGLKALSDYFKQTNITVKPSDMSGMYRRLQRPLPSRAPLVSLIIPTRDKAKLLKKCISSLLSKTNYPNVEIIIVDNQSTEDETLNYLEHIEEHANVRVIKYPQNFNFSAINNFAVKQAYGELIGFINNDIEVISPEWLDEMVSNAIRPEVGAVGAKLLYANNTIQHAGVILGIGGMADHAHKFLPENDAGYFGRANLQQEFSAVTAACMVMRKEVFVQAGMFDEVNLTVAFNDVDLCLKVKDLGLKIIYTPYATLYHHESISRGSENTSEKQKRQAAEIKFMRKKWGPKLKHDPFYNRNLSLDTANFKLKNSVKH
jgi:O-antigen biosynthesis protein